jgi:hypothetical protein
MLKVFRRAATAVWVLAIAPFLAHAQQPIRDPLGGQFGAMEIAMSPKAALRDAELLGAALSGLKPQRPGVVDAYVFAASLWNDPVFEREASEAARILAQRFDAEGRTVILSAGAGAPDRAYPAASPNNVNAALAKIGATIDPAEDLVVVFLTSHGSPDGAVALQEKNRMGGAMRAAHLRASLNAAGVRNRVVIVSACYSGAFIQPFSDAFTAVFTAAAADRPSFGCQPDRDWTYFGDAFLNRALRTSAGIEQAFDVSLSTILDWEQKLAAEWSAKPPALRARSLRSSRRRNAMASPSSARPRRPARFASSRPAGRWRALRTQSPLSGYARTTRCGRLSSRSSRSVRRTRRRKRSPPPPGRLVRDA